MQNDVKRDEPLSPEIQEVMKNLISAIRIVKIYPANNPVYSRSLKKSFQALSDFLETSSEYYVGVQKSYFTYADLPLWKDTEVNKSIALDLFNKRIREIVFISGIAEEELQEFFHALALPAEELDMRSGISSILWEKGVSHVKVSEAGLDEVITAGTEGARPTAGATSRGTRGDAEKSASFAPKTLMVTDVLRDHEAFGSAMLAFAMRTCAEHESVEDRLFTLYSQAGSKVLRDHGSESEVLFEGLAKSVLDLEYPYRTGLIAGKLYGDLDEELASLPSGNDHYLPNAVQEIQTARFSDLCSSRQVAVLLKRSASKKNFPSAPPALPVQIEATPIPKDIEQIARSLQDNGAVKAESLKPISDSGMESDIIEAAVRTLVSLVPRIKHGRFRRTAEAELKLFSGVVRQLEDILNYLLKKNKYELATIIIKTLRTPVDPEFQPRMNEAIKKTATKSIIKETIAEMRKHRKRSAGYEAAYSYLSNLERKATEALLELLTEERDREIRIFLLELLKDFGKDQIALLAEHLADGRWYVVRNIVRILAENKTDQAIALLRRAADHEQIQIRREVINALVSTGGKKAAVVLARFLLDRDESIQLTALRAFADFRDIGAEESRPVIEFLRDRPLAGKAQELTLEAIRTLGKIGGSDAIQFLERYSRIRWWKSRKLQVELRDAATRAGRAIIRRQADAGRTK